MTSVAGDKQVELNRFAVARLELAGIDYVIARCGCFIEFFYALKQNVN